MSINTARKLLGVVFVLMLSFCLKQTIDAQSTRMVTGTYTNMYYHQAGGDVIGQELKIVMVQGGGYQGALQFAEGEPGDLLIVDVTVTGNRITFSVPDADAHAGQFGGELRNGVIQGEFRYRTGGVEKVALKKGKSYWD